MKERPIPFNGAMVRAILDGRKTHTRRPMNPQPVGNVLWTAYPECKSDAEHVCPYGPPGDRLWVRETWQTLQIWDHLPPNKVPTDSDIQYPATWDHWVSKRRPSIHMPRWASRIALEITGVRVERLQDITEEGAKAEGLIGIKGSEESPWFTTPISEFHDLWDSIYRGDCRWDANPWIWDVEFRVIEAA